MAHKDPEAERSTALNLNPGDLAEFGKKRVEAMIDVQKELFDEIQEFNEHWFARAKSEADFASKFVGKFTAARSVPETLTACQECASHQMQMAAEDGQRVFADGLKLIETYARLFSNGGAGART